MKLIEIKVPASQSDSSSKQELDELVEKIKTECSDIVNLYRKTKKLLYRGDRDRTSEFYGDTIRSDRKPTDMIPSIHKVLEIAFKDYGLIANRTNSIFVTGDKDVAYDWGSPYIIFPVNGWHATAFMKTLNDYMYHVFMDELNHYHIKNKAAVLNARKSYSLALDLLKEYEAINLTAKSDNMEVLLKHNVKELLISGQKYYAVSVTAKNKNYILDKLFSNK